MLMNLIYGLCRSAQSEVEKEREGKEKAKAELSQCSHQLSEVETRVVSLEQSVTEYSQTNTDLRAQLE